MNKPRFRLLLTKEADDFMQSPAVKSEGQDVLLYT